MSWIITVLFYWRCNFPLKLKIKLFEEEEKKFSPFHQDLNALWREFAINGKVVNWTFVLLSTKMLSPVGLYAICQEFFMRAFFAGFFSIQSAVRASLLLHCCIPEYQEGNAYVYRSLFIPYITGIVKITIASTTLRTCAGLTPDLIQSRSTTDSFILGELRRLWNNQYRHGARLQSKPRRIKEASQDHGRSLTEYTRVRSHPPFNRHLALGGLFRTRRGNKRSTQDSAVIQEIEPIG